MLYPISGGSRRGPTNNSDRALYIDNNIHLSKLQFNGKEISSSTTVQERFTL